MVAWLGVDRACRGQSSAQLNGISRTREARAHSREPKYLKPPGARIRAPGMSVAAKPSVGGIRGRRVLEP